MGDGARVGRNVDGTMGGWRAAGPNSSRFSCVRLFATPSTVACQTALSMGFFKQEYWSGLLCPPPEDLPDSRTEPESPVPPAWQVDSLTAEPPGTG